MHEIIKATYELIDELEKSDLINKLTLYKDKVKSNSKLCDLLKKGKESDDQYLILDIRKKLYKNMDYQSYVHYYNELFYIVMDINKRYQKLLSSRSCNK